MEESEKDKRIQWLEEEVRQWKNEASNLMSLPDYAFTIGDIQLKLEEKFGSPFVERGRE